ncbi:20243_t:CDS:10 [Cetraspora pellucida]|uniref:20243_t:CDS:1 n=1 Tax=Cetraspora pellucida TaxID=1433469 RepID=A0A9N9BQE7_9GLOM|nr:20243_t:CDS:10 [Cetraspora pellucida]
MSEAQESLVKHEPTFSNTLTFFLNFLAIIPLAGLLTMATEEIAMKTSPTVGGLLSATFGNAIELIISIIALDEGLIRVVQGLKYKEQEFNITAAQTSSSLLALTMISLVIPAAYSSTTESDKVAAEGYEGVKDEDEEPKTILAVSITTLIIVTGFVTLCAEFLVDSIDGLVENWGISTTFVGIVLIPIVGNAAEHVSSVTFALKNKMDLCIIVALGSSMQIALGVTPILILIGWIINQPLTLFFETFETCVLVVSVLIVNYLIQDGQSNWLEGAMLLVSIFPSSL